VAQGFPIAGLVRPGRPVWLFSSGPLGTGAEDAKGRDLRSAAEPGEIPGFTKAICPRGRHVFFGAPPPEPQLRVTWEPLSAGGDMAAPLPGLPVPALARDHPREPGGAWAGEVAGLA
jgi:hypothetical protein